MKSLQLLIASLFFSSLLAQAVETPKVAQVDYSQIEELLEDIVFAKAENKELASRYRDRKKKEREQQEKIQKAVLSGEKINPLEMARNFTVAESLEDNNKVEQQCKKHLLTVIENTFNDKYDVILKKSYRSNMLYTKVAIDDITEILLQELLKALPERK